MLDMFKKRLGVEAATDVVALALHEALQQEFSAFKEKSEKSLAETLSQKQELAAQLEAAQARLAELEQFAADAEAAKQALLAEAEAKRLQVRKDQIVAAVGTARADALMTATEALDEAAFNAVVSALTVTAQTEKQSVMFTETGVSGSADATKVEESPEMKILKARYSK